MFLTIVEHSACCSRGCHGRAAEGLNLTLNPNLPYTINPDPYAQTALGFQVSVLVQSLLVIFAFVPCHESFGALNFLFSWSHFVNFGFQVCKGLGLGQRGTFACYALPCTPVEVTAFV